MNAIKTDTLDNLDQAAWDGIQSLIDNYAHITQEDNVVLAYTLDVREPAAWVALALELRGVSTTLIPMLPLRDPDFCQRLSTSIAPYHQTHRRCVVVLFERDTVSHDEILQQTFMNYALDRYLVVRALNASRHLFANGLKVKPEEHAAKNAAIFEHCRDSSSLTITTPSGTELEVGLDLSRFRWLSMSGIIYSGKALVLPSGEIATYPVTVSGRLVADFALQANFRIIDDIRLNTSPLTLDIKNSEVADFSCARPEIMRILDKAFTYENARRVGELGFGTNTQVEIPAADNCLLNERCPGVHLGFGNHNQAIGDVGFECETHVDLIARGGLIRANASGKYIDLADIQPSSNWRSLHLGRGHEDVLSPPLTDADCCAARF